MKTKFSAFFFSLLVLTTFSCSVVNKNIPYSHVIKTFDMEGWVVDVAVCGNYVYIANTNYGLQIVNISDVFAVRNVNTIGQKPATGFNISSNFIYVVGGGNGMDVMDIKQPENAIFVTNLGGGIGYFTKIKIKDNCAYAIDEIKGLCIYDINTGLYITNIPVTYTSRDIFVDGNYAYVISSDSPWMGDYCHSTLEIISISNTNDIHTVNSLTIGGNSTQVYVERNYAYIANYTKGLYIIDVSKPTNASIINSMDVSGSIVQTVFVTNDRAYVGGSWGVRVLDVSNPLNAREIDVAYTDFYILKLVVVGKYVYVVGEDSMFVSCFAIAEMLGI